MFAVQPSPVVVTAGVVLPVDCTKLTPPAPYAAVYFTESAKYASSAVTRFRRSDFIEAMYAFAFVLANFGIAMAAKMPMITTTISSSMSVKPLRFMLDYPPVGERWAQEHDSGEPSGFPRSKVTLAGVGYRLRRSNSRGWRIESPRVH